MAKPTLSPVAEANDVTVEVNNVNEEQIEQAESVKEEKIKKKSKWSCCKCFCEIFNFCFGAEDGVNDAEEIEIQGVYINESLRHSGCDDTRNNDSNLHQVNSHHGSSNDLGISNFVKLIGDHGNGHSSVGHSGVGHSDVGHSSVGHSGVGHSDVGHSSVGHSGVGHSDVGHSDIGNFGGGDYGGGDCGGGGCDD